MTMDTDFIPNKSSSNFYLPITSSEQEGLLKEEKADAHKYADILQNILDRLDERIALYQSLDSISDATISNPQLLAQTIHANRLTVDNLRQERGVIKDIIDSK